MKKTFQIFLILCMSVVLFSNTSYAKMELRPPPLRQDNLFLQNIDILPHITSKNLTLVPIRIERNGLFKGLLSMEEALYSGALSVTETGDVNNLYIENRSNHWVFIMGGEIITGGKQNRILQHDVLLSPWSGRINVGAFCVEQGRWSGAAPGSKFSSSKSVANLGVRQHAGEYKEQSRVWSAVRKTNEKVAAESSTDDLNKAYESPKVKADKDRFNKELNYGIRKVNNINGFVVYINNRLIAVDIFGSRDLFEKYRDKLIDSYTLEAISREDEDDITPRVKDNWLNYEESAKRFLEEASLTNLSPVHNIGSGNLLELETGRQFGRFLVTGKSLVHAEIFPRASETPIHKPYIERQYPR